MRYHYWMKNNLCEKLLYSMSKKKSTQESSNYLNKKILKENLYNHWSHRKISDSVCSEENR